MNSIIKNLMKKGIVKGKSQLLTDSEIKELEKLILKNKDKHPKKEGKVSQNIIGIDQRIDELLEKIITNPEVHDTLEKVLGKNFLIRQIIARFNEPTDKGLTLHQDAPGETSLLVLVNNQPEGSTVFFPGSQLIPSEKHTAAKVSWNSLKLIKITKYFLMSAIGNAGNYYYFLHRTWHCRTPGKNDGTNISLFFNMFPVSAKRKEFVHESAYNSMINWEFVKQPHLKKMISRKNYQSAIDAFEKDADKTYSLSMKTNTYNQISKNKLYFTFMILKILLLETIFFPITVKRYIKNLIKVK
tara:strand:- start:344 stop:1240 length:897 start_codon:yes stop_codon:yes gene_type:complete